MDNLENKLRVGSDEVGSYGYFERQSYDFQGEFGEDQHPIEAGRYRLFWGKLCQWSNWHSIILDLLGLSEEAITHNIVEKDPDNKELGWQFLYDKHNTDPVLGVNSLNEVYRNTDPAYKGRMTTPCLVDIHEKVVISNDFTRLPYQLEIDFKPLHKDGAPDLLPKTIEKEIREFNKWLFYNVNNAVYRTSFCTKKEAYWEDYYIFYAALDILNDRLQDRRFLFGDYITDSDIKLYNTLTRLDVRYTHQLGQIKKPLFEYENLWPYARDLYSITEFKQNTYFSDFAMPSNNQTHRIYEAFNERLLCQIDFDRYWSIPNERHHLSLDPNQVFLIN